jgi:predicted small lipoprotein YifL
MKKRIVLILVLVMLVTITACQPVSETPPQQPSEEQGQAPAEKSDETYVFLTALASTFWRKLQVVFP